MAVGVLNRTAFDDALKINYSPLRMYNLAVKGKPFLTAVNKDTNLGGSGQKIFIQYGNPQGVSKTFGDAQDNASTVLVKAWLITPVELFGISTIDGMTIATAEKSKDSFIGAVTAQVDGTLDSVGQRLAKFLYGNGSGSLGRILSGQTTATVTLTNRYDIVNFQPDMKLEVDDVDSTSSAAKTGEVTVKSVDRVLGTITIIDSETAWSTQIGGIAANDYIFADGDAAQLGTGLKSWLLDAAAASTTFFGVDRSSDNRLYGQYYNGSGETVADAFKHGLFENMLENDRQDLKLFTHPAQTKDLVDLMGQKVQYVQNPGKISGAGPDGAVGFETIRIVTPMGQVDVASDRYCDSNIGWGLNMEGVTLWSAGAIPRVLGDGPGEDGLFIQRAASANRYEVRTGGYWNLAVAQPGRHVRILLPTAS